MLTNNHCVPSDDDAKYVQVEFGATCASCEDPKNFVQLACKGTMVASSVTLVATSHALDFSLVKLNLFPYIGDLSSYGYLQARDSVPVLDEPIWLAGHPRGSPMRIASTTDGGVPGTIVSTNVADSCSTNAVGYLLDTESGSSGSPVLSTTDNSVIALHNCGGCNAATKSNGGIPIASILAYLRTNGIPLPPNSVSATPTPTPTMTPASTKTPPPPTQTKTPTPTQAPTQNPTQNPTESPTTPTPDVVPACYTE
ncbi:hypothetical protein SDRG_04447 [Saprolegnia diclina VS20]|uniref:Serine protease n=1 Tax=Saprolegnia diclina (strain VS20) TaxID=1156394 RepID=T0S5R2_SAPDV|nr:hypothetical protein SDRG_04447 [Saprolegnia diclina VS20]EQC38017.1 hypothetical protein SDRG_04447 [Saprolegnia diclina VS20]|eukprot:XP_008608344.1 hypothetical protein SDRG_04447 [Saprolegnia diclina VS20]